MNKKVENGVAWAMAIILAVLFCLSLFGCKTRTLAEKEYVSIHDTVIVHHTDTVKDVKVKVVRDTTKQIEVHTYTLNNVGDTVKEIHHYHDIMRTIVVDSTERYKAKVDSLRQALAKEQAKEKVIKKGIKVPWWAWIIVPIILLIGLHFIIKFIMYKRWHVT